VWAVLAVVVFFAGRRAIEVWANGFDDLGLLDLQVYRMGGQAVLDGRPLYELAYAHDGLPFTYTPFAALVFVPLALAGWTGGALVMTFASLAALVRTAQLVARATVPTGFHPRVSPALRTTLLVVFGLSIWPTLSTTQFGQVNLVVLWLVVEDLLGRGRVARWGGLLIGIAAGLKLTPALFIVFLLVTRRTRQATIAVLAGGGTVALGAVVQPASAWTYWTDTFFESNRVGTPQYLGNQSLNGIVHRVVGPDGSTTVLWLALSVVVLVGALWLARALWHDDRPAQAVLVVGLATLVVSPISWTHHWVWLVMVPACLLRVDGRGRTGLFEPRAPRPPEGLGLTLIRLALVVATVVVAVPDFMQHLPNDGGAEFDYSPVEQVVAGGYPLLALAVMALLAWTVVAGRATRTGAGPGPGSGLHDDSASLAARVGGGVNNA
jgi:alpha-1,2-mannosyltransferase